MLLPMAKKLTIASAVYLATDIGCAVAVNGAAILALRGPFWNYLTALQVF